METEFTLAGYETLVRRLLDLGYVCRGYDDAAAARPHLILRHDIDMSLHAAVAMAERESALGVTATYFVLLRTELYNPLSGEGLQAVTRLRDLGHEIGLHLDASLYADGEATAIDDGAARECAILEAATGEPVRVISFHRPAKALLGSSDPVAGRRHAYQPRYFSEMAYCADSRGAWHHGHPLDHPAVSARQALQLLTHPIWWCRDEAESPDRRTVRFLAERIAVLDSELAANCSVHPTGSVGTAHFS